MPLAIWPDLKPVANVFGGQEEKFLQRARVPVDAAHGATLAAFGWVLEWVVLARLPCLQALSNRFSFLLSGHGGNICWLFIVVCTRASPFRFSFLSAGHWGNICWLFIAFSSAAHPVRHVSLPEPALWVSVDSRTKNLSPFSNTNTL